MTDALNVVILAAGMGKRMHSRLPKVLHELGGRPMLAHIIETARGIEPAPTRICVVYGHGGEQVPQAFPGPHIKFAKQEPQLGTGHAVQQSLPHLIPDARTLVLYGDVPLVRTGTLAALLKSTAKGLGILTVDLDDPAGYGRIIRDAANKVTGIVEEKDATARQKKVREVNTGIMVLPGAKLAKWLKMLRNDNAQGEYYLTDVVRLAIKDKVRVVAVKAQDPAESLGVNSKLQLAEVERIHQRRIARELMASGVSLADPDRIDVRGRLRTGMDVQIDVNCVFEGDVTLGDGVSIGANCVVRDVAVGAGTEILPFCHIESAKVGPGCRIGPFARLRPGADLAEDVHIGNFVEVKASTVGLHSKVNHLAYVGDSSVGKNVNIGAGSITCNYDGAFKHRTTIEDDVHIGSDVQLVAPVTVGQGATIGAGTTVWRDVPQGGLVTNTKTQVHRPDWQRPAKKSA